MKDYRSTPLPKLGSGPVTGDVLNHWMESVMREVLAKADIRNPVSDVADGIVASQSTGLVTLGTDARSSSQRLLTMVSTGNRNSVQSADDILSATSDTSATISITAHSVKYAFGTVSYNSGTISGLTVATVYHVYVDDPEYSGGAVSYLATTNPDNLIATGRYYVGTVTTPAANSSSSVDGATSANPISITTSAAHGRTTGDVADFASMPGDFAPLNTGTYPITVTGATTFTVAVDGSAYAAYTSGGTVTFTTPAASGGGGSGGGSGGGTRWGYLRDKP